jgi:hypothetical protein
MLNKLTVPSAWIKRLPDAMGTVSEVAKAKVSQREREKLDARCFKTSLL